nr:MAG TPA: hypothetical protein [Caudoviricetes sp.]
MIYSYRIFYHSFAVLAILCPLSIDYTAYL